MEVLLNISKSAIENESTFRDILRDLKERFPNFVPETLNPDGEIDSLLNLFTPPLASIGFGIGEFEVGPESSNNEEVGQQLKLHSNELAENEAVIEIHNFLTLSGYNMILLYDVTPNQPLQFKGHVPGMIMRS
jgi:hypothetical protein